MHSYLYRTSLVSVPFGLPSKDYGVAVQSGYV
uniref:Uncharacterized protein n=1 Tax=Arundo donax TaxID=35708 RepID=A0A0A9H7H1_ARUDO